MLFLADGGKLRHQVEIRRFPDVLFVLRWFAMPFSCTPRFSIAAVLAVLICAPLTGRAQIVADHNAVADYRKIPAAYIELVKKMWLNVPGESHSYAYRRGVTLLASQESAYAAVASESGAPTAYTDKSLRVSRTTWGDVSHATGWVAGYGEEDWFTSATAIEQSVKALMMTVAVAWFPSEKLAILAFAALPPRNSSSYAHSCWRRSRIGCRPRKTSC